ncbi:MAG: tetratricopeptide repeat protein [Chitinophagales bacterium]|nr:tetratricopeptide repeat protein [Chitinophagales bacterium]
MKEKKKKRVSGIKQQPLNPLIEPRGKTGLDALFSSRKNQVITVILLSFLFYGNSIWNGYALDDGLVLRDNAFVQRGISGIPDILSHDSFYGSIGQSKNLSGGRYRPLSLVSFAIENSFFGNGPAMHHLINVLLYALTGVVLLVLLRKFILPGFQIGAFCASILFVIHPVHSEVVANIKSRDEIFSLLFLLLNLYFLLLYINQTHKIKHFIFSVIFYFLALFSKENGFTFLFIIPLTLYFFAKESWLRIFRLTIPFLLVAVFYVLIRISLLGFQNNEIKSVLDNPFVLATPLQKYATVLLVYLKNLHLLFSPYYLTYDYSFNQIPYQSFASPLVLLSLIIHASLIGYAIYKLKSKDLVSYCILFYLASIFIVSNLLFNIGAPMAERFLFQPSISFVIIVVEILRRAVMKLNWRMAVQSGVAVALTFIVVILSAIKVISRNTDWKSDETLFLHDVKLSSGSARANAYAGVALVHNSDQVTEQAQKISDLKTSIGYFKKSIVIQPGFITPWLNIGVAYVRLDSTEKAEAAWNKARAIDPDDGNLKEYDKYLANYHYKKGMTEGTSQNFDASITEFLTAVRYAPNDAEGWYNLGGAYFSKKEYEKAKQCWQKTLFLNPQHAQALAGMDAIKQLGL